MVHIFSNPALLYARVHDHDMANTIWTIHPQKFGRLRKFVVRKDYQTTGLHWFSECLEEFFFLTTMYTQYKVLFLLFILHWPLTQLKRFCVGEAGSGRNFFPFLPFFCLFVCLFVSPYETIVSLLLSLSLPSDLIWLINCKKKISLHKSSIFSLRVTFLKKKKSLQAIKWGLSHKGELVFLVWMGKQVFLILTLLWKTLHIYRSKWCSPIQSLSTTNVLFWPAICLLSPFFVLFHSWFRIQGNPKGVFLSDLLTILRSTKEKKSSCEILLHLQVKIYSIFSHALIYFLWSL